MKSRQRVQLQPAFLLHRRAFRETSVIAEFLTRDYGRVALVVRGGRGQASRRCLEVFSPLLLSWSSRGELGTLTGVEPAGRAVRLAHKEVFSGYYANELLLRMVLKHEAVTEIYHAYECLLTALTERQSVARALRVFEKRLLQELGYGADLSREWRSDRVLEATGFYRVSPEQGPEPVASDLAESDIFSGSSLISLANETLEDPQSLSDARRLLRAWLDYYLDGRPLKSRELVRSMYGQKSRPRELAARDADS